MFISKAEKARLHSHISDLNKVMIRLTLKLDKLEETVKLMRRIDAPLAVAPEAEEKPEVHVEPTDYHELFKVKRKRKSPDNSKSKYVRQFIDNMSVNQSVSIPANGLCDVKDLRSAVSSQMHAIYGHGAFVTRIDSVENSVMAVRLK